MMIDPSQPEYDLTCALAGAGRCLSRQTLLKLLAAAVA
jgi:hypothetical protein